MGIDIKWETERGEALEGLLDPKGILPSLLHRAQTSQWQLIKYIDPYGDTVFNQLQLPTLQEELGGLGRFTESDEERIFLNSLLDLFARAKGEVHTYVRFYGD